MGARQRLLSLATVSHLQKPSVKLEYLRLPVRSGEDSAVHHTKTWSIEAGGVQRSLHSTLVITEGNWEGGAARKQTAQAWMPARSPALCVAIPRSMALKTNTC